MAEGVLQRREPVLETGSFAVLGPHGVLVVDTLLDPPQARAAREELEALTHLPVVGLVLTHAHWDHCFGAVVYEDVPVWAHHRLPEHLGRVEAAELAAGRPAQEVEVDWSRAALPRPTHLVSGTTTIAPGGRPVQLEAWAPAHTTCDLSVHVPGVWLVGDLVEESGPPSVEEDSDLAGWAVALEALCARLGPEDLVVPGHGSPVGRDFVAAQAALLRRDADAPGP